VPARKEILKKMEGLGKNERFFCRLLKSSLLRMVVFFVAIRGLSVLH
jgi:hypothetical protein